ncbi:MAG: hypothetical protein ISS93_00090 [Candidatus Aenigmarchaeota archaeon]|nr:hypothetical protein [Candidatus Aenigmarchaeota archaeon]
MLCIELHYPGNDPSFVEDIRKEVADRLKVFADFAHSIGFNHVNSNVGHLYKVIRKVPFLRLYGSDLDELAQVRGALRGVMLEIQVMPLIEFIPE